jgi:hypothetical protein
MCRERCREDLEDTHFFHIVRSLHGGRQCPSAKHFAPSGVHRSVGRACEGRASSRAHRVGARARGVPDGASSSATRGCRAHAHYRRPGRAGHGGRSGRKCGNCFRRSGTSRPLAFPIQRGHPGRSSHWRPRPLSLRISPAGRGTLDRRARSGPLCVACKLFIVRVAAGSASHTCHAGVTFARAAATTLPCSGPVPSAPRNRGGGRTLAHG